MSTSNRGPRVQNLLGIIDDRECFSERLRDETFAAVTLIILRPAAAFDNFWLQVYGLGDAMKKRSFQVLITSLLMVGVFLAATELSPYSQVKPSGSLDSRIERHAEIAQLPPNFTPSFDGTKLPFTLRPDLQSMTVRGVQAIFEHFGALLCSAVPGPCLAGAPAPIALHNDCP
jgi:hypothetical protein